jgi:uncharacterized protein YbgA (DUF1722 family)/uncharacterized protein YbbK (DUF523 family)
MSREFPRPVVVSSKCIEFDHCRYNGEMIHSDFVRKLKAHAEMRPVCMEAEIGLGVPRDPVRVILTAEGRRLFQPASGRDVTRAAEEFSAGYISQLGEVDGFLLKSRSPSCGTRDTKVYPPGEKVAAISTREAGIFGGMVLAAFPFSPVEDEMRLSNQRIAEHFLMRVFSMAGFRGIRGRGMKALIDFHSDHKFQLMAQSQKGLRELGGIVANHRHLPEPEVERAYASSLAKVLAPIPRCGSEVNVMSHLFGYVSDGLGADEKQFFLRTLEQYRQGELPATVPLQLLRSYVARFGEPYLRRQTFLEPFPEEFLAVRGGNACVGRDLD